MTNPQIITPSEAYELACCTGVESDGLPGGLYEFCNEVLKFWNAKPVNDESWVNLVFMLSSVFVAGMVYARDGGISRVKIKITYTAEEQQLFERVRAELLQTMPTARQHESKAPAGTKIFYTPI